MSQLSELQKVELGILRVFSETAEKEKLTWFVMFGTLLGAVRQKGFIPWDDDIDIAMPRADYDRLRLSQGWFREPYFLQTPQNDPAAAPRFIRLRRSDTAVLIDFPNGLTRGGNMGAYIDILPLDDVPNGVQAREISQVAKNINRQMLASAALDECGSLQVPEWKKRICYSAGGVADMYQLLSDRYEKLCSQFSGMPYYAMPTIIGERGYRVFDKAWFSKCLQMEFEGLAVPVPVGCKEALIVSFPDGIYEPEEKDRKAKHTDNCIVDMSRSYKEYVSRYTDMLYGIEGKKVYIFGAGDSLRIWLERYSEGLDVVCAFDNAKSKWGTDAYGVPVHPPSDIYRLLDDDSRLIIASIHHKEIAEQLDNMGITDYYFFIDGMYYSREF